MISYSHPHRRRRRRRLSTKLTFAEPIRAVGIEPEK
jgi:hypothetical protein